VLGISRRDRELAGTWLSRSDGLGQLLEQDCPAPSPTSDTYYRAFTGIVTGPYMTGLRQYRGVGPGAMLGGSGHKRVDVLGKGRFDGELLTRAGGGPRHTQCSRVTCALRVLRVSGPLRAQERVESNA